MSVDPAPAAFRREVAACADVADSLPAEGLHTVEKYEIDSARRRVLRHVQDRNGNVLTSAVAWSPQTLSHLSAADAHDSAWLRSQAAPLAPGGPALSMADLFSGCGGLTVGAVEACRALGRPVEHALAVDIEPAALAVYGDNFPGADLRDQPIEMLVDGPLGSGPTPGERKLGDRLTGLDLVVAGPPCQGHSDLNNHTRRQDPKNVLYLKVARFVEVVRPRNVVIENVPGVAHDRHGVVPLAINALRQAGYTVTAGVVHAVELGVPQNRKRHLLLATLDEKSLGAVQALSWQFHAPHRSVMWAISDLDEDPEGGTFDTSARHSPTNNRRIKYLFDHGLYDLPNEQRPDCHRLKPHSYTSVYGRMRPDRPAPTITAGFGSTGQGRFVHPERPRTLTPHEAARLQGFPDFFRFSSAAGRRALQQMIGNAVHTRLAYSAVLGLVR
ncbi:DNA cytosine methyltransferase [Micromonospora sp. NPDC002296]|uniref:DNA cytosine methyltransferase n=1 Tax=Micromonospora sp. NPDC002296 TaxID=3154271 RepID=UPI00332369CF